MYMGAFMAKERIFNKTHYESAWRYLDALRPGIFTPEMFRSGQDPSYENFSAYAMDSIITLEEPSLIANYLNIFFHIYHMKKSCEKIYYVTPELSARLAQTSINVDSYFLKSPFREIYVQIDPGLFYINDIGGLNVPVHGFYVYLRDFGEYKQIRIMACSLLKPTPEIPFNDANFYFHVEINPAGKLQSQLKKHIETKVEPELKNLKRYDLANNIDYLEDFTAFAFNVLLYITSKRPNITNLEPANYSEKLKNIKSASKRRKIEKRAEKASTHRIIVIGEDIQDKNNDMEKIREAGGIGLWKLKNKVRVSGHWRTQWYGSEKDNTRRADQIFVDDYTKGPEFSDMVSSKFIVK